MTWTKFQYYHVIIVFKRNFPLIINFSSTKFNLFNTPAITGNVFHISQHFRNSPMWIFFPRITGFKRLFQLLYRLYYNYYIFLLTLLTLSNPKMIFTSQKLFLRKSRRSNK